MAQATSRARLYALLPEADSVLVYRRTDGQEFLPKDSGYVGINAAWTIWEWGASFYFHRTAVAQARVAAAQTADVERQVTLEAATRLAQLKAARSAVDVASASIASAEEAWRVMEAQVKVGSATTTISSTRRTRSRGRGSAWRGPATRRPSPGWAWRGRSGSRPARRQGQPMPMQAAGPLSIAAGPGM